MKNKKGKVPGWVWFLIILVIIGVGIAIYVSTTGDTGGAENLANNGGSAGSSGLQPPALPS